MAKWSPMSAFPPPRRTLLTGVKVTAVLSLPLAAAVLLMGEQAVLPAVMGLMAAAVVPFCTLRQSIALVAGLVITGAAATAAYGHPVAVVTVVVVVCLAAGLLSRFSDGVYGVAPVVAAVLALNPPATSALTAALVMAMVGAYVIVVGRLLRIQLEPKPVPLDVALRNAGVMAVACGSATAVAVRFDWPKSYWLVMTLAIVLRPYASDSLVKNRRRVVGTLAGAMIAAVLSPLPRPWQILFAGVCMALMLAYMLLGDYVLQVTFMTPMIIFLVSSGAVDDTLSMDGLRVLYTVSACLVGGLLALALARRPSRVDEQSAAPA